CMQGRKTVMKLGARRLVGGMAATAVCLLAVVPARAQREADEKPLMSEQVFKNVQVLKGIPVTEFMATMGFFSASLGLNCTSCHVAESLSNWEKYADDGVPLKRTARKMVQMVTTINKSNFAEIAAVSCYPSHRG